MADDMTTYNIREFKSKISEIINTLEYDQEVIITRRGKPCGRLTSVELPAEEKAVASDLERGLDSASGRNVRGLPGHQVHLGASCPAVRRRADPPVLDSPFKFVVDTHALWWYLRSPERLSPAASAVFRLAETGNATIVVPAIAVAELYYLSVKLGQAVSPSDLLYALAGVGGIELSDLGRTQLGVARRVP